jgi:hypothetical protein
LPVVDNLAEEYDDRIAFVAVAWKGTPEDTAARASELMPSGSMVWGLDVSEEIFARYEVPYQPVTVLISADKQVVERWPGLRDEDEIRAALDRLSDSSVSG